MAIGYFELISSRFSRPSPETRTYAAKVAVLTIKSSMNFVAGGTGESDAVKSLPAETLKGITKTG